MPGEAWCAPVFPAAAGRAEQVGGEEGEDGNGMEGASAGTCEIDVGAVGLEREGRGQQDGKGNEREAGESCHRKGEGGAFQGCDGFGGLKDAPEGIGDEKVDAEQGDLVAAKNEDGCGDAGSKAVKDFVGGFGVSGEGAIEQQEDDGEHREAEDLAGVLDAPGHGGAESEGDGRERCTCFVPAAVAEPGNEGKAADEDGDEDGGVDGPGAGVGVKASEDDEGRREDHRLRVGDLGVA